MKHTPTPWHVTDTHPTRACLGIADERGCSLADLYCAPGDGYWTDRPDDEPTTGDHERVANANFIVTACNAHDALVAALREIAKSDPYSKPSAGVIALTALIESGVE